MSILSVIAHPVLINCCSLSCCSATDDILLAVLLPGHNLRVPQWETVWRHAFRLPTCKDRQTISGRCTPMLSEATSFRYDIYLSLVRFGQSWEADLAASHPCAASSHEVCFYQAAHQQPLRVQQLQGFTASPRWRSQAQTGQTSSHPSPEGTHLPGHIGAPASQTPASYSRLTACAIAALRCLPRILQARLEHGISTQYTT